MSEEVRTVGLSRREGSVLSLVTPHRDETSESEGDYFQERQSLTMGFSGCCCAGQPGAMTGLSQ